MFSLPLLEALVFQALRGVETLLSFWLQQGKILNNAGGKEIDGVGCVPCVRVLALVVVLPGYDGMSLRRLEFGVGNVGVVQQVLELRASSVVLVCRADVE